MAEPMPESVQTVSLRVVAARLLCGLLAVACGFGRAAADEPALFAEQVFQHHVEHLASADLKGRSREGAPKAAEYLRDEFRKLGLQPLFEESYFQDVPGYVVEGQNRIRAGRNVGAVLPGSDPQQKDEYIIIAAHYDHLGRSGDTVFPGADDNASGTSMLLEVARAYATLEEKPRRSIVFLGFDLEERLLWGSRWFAAHPPWPLERVKCCLVADMIGRSLGDLKLGTVFVMGSEHSPELSRTLTDAEVPEGLEVARLGVDLIGVRSDYGPFWNEQIPFLFFSTGEHPDYHQPSDTADKVDFPQVARVSRLIHAVSRQVADLDQPPTWQEEVEPSIEEVKSVRRIADLLLKKQNPAKPLGPSQLLLLGHVKSRSTQIIDKGEMTDGERSWLIRVSQILLFSVL